MAAVNGTAASYDSKYLEPYMSMGTDAQSAGGSVGLDNATSGKPVRVRPLISEFISRLTHVAEESGVDHDWKKKIADIKSPEPAIQERSKLIEAERARIDQLLKAVEQNAIPICKSMGLTSEWAPALDIVRCTLYPSLMSDQISKNSTIVFPENRTIYPLVRGDVSRLPGSLTFLSSL